MNLDPDSLVTNPFVAALAGAALGLRALPGANIYEKAANLAFGFIVAIFAGPAVLEWLHITSLKLSAGVIFGFGAAGLVLFGAIIEGVKSTQFGVIIQGWLSKRGS
jgi:hypothetical protein